MTDDEIPPWEHVRTTDPDTSREAAYRLSTAETQMRRLLTAYGVAGELTCEESAAFAGYEHEPSTKRVSDLLRLELIEDTGYRRPGTSGRSQMVCRITTAGREALDNE